VRWQGPAQGVDMSCAARLARYIEVSVDGFLAGNRLDRTALLPLTPLRIVSATSGASGPLLARVRPRSKIAKNR
jgi:hypothetical protein